MFHRRYSASSAAKPVSPAPIPPPEPPEPGFTLHVQVPGADPDHQRERLRQRQEEMLLQQELLAREQELVGIKEEEKELARRREELQILNSRQTEFHERRLALEAQIGRTLQELEREKRRCDRNAKALDDSLAVCRRYLQKLERLDPAVLSPVRNETAFRRHLELIESLERQLEAELGGLREFENEPPDAAEPWGLGDSFQRGLRFFLPYLGLGAVGLVVFLSLTGGGR